MRYRRRGRFKYRRRRSSRSYGRRRRAGVMRIGYRM